MSVLIGSVAGVEVTVHSTRMWCPARMCVMRLRGGSSSSEITLGDVMRRLICLRVIGLILEILEDVVVASTCLPLSVLLTWCSAGTSLGSQC